MSDEVHIFLDGWPLSLRTWSIAKLRSLQTAGIQTREACLADPESFLTEPKPCSLTARGSPASRA